MTTNSIEVRIAALADRLRSWAQNEEMVDQGFTAHGKDCNQAAEDLERMCRLLTVILRD